MLLPSSQQLELPPWTGGHVAAQSALFVQSWTHVPFLVETSPGQWPAVDGKQTPEAVSQQPVIVAAQ